MSSRKALLQKGARFQLLWLLEANPETSQRELADVVGISTGAVYYLLSALVERSLVRLGNFSVSAAKRRYAYSLTPKGVVEMAAIAG